MLENVDATVFGGLLALRVERDISDHTDDFWGLGV